MPDAPYAPLGMGAGIPPADQQAAMIDRIRLMATSPDPQQRALAQEYMSRFGRSMLAVGLNRATSGLGTEGGLSDWLMTHAPGQPPGKYVGRYAPEEMQYAKDLTQAVKPGEYHGAEMAGTAANLGASALGGNWLRRLLFGGRLGTPQPQPGAPMSPAGMPAPGAPPGPPPSPMGPAPPLLPEGAPGAPVEPLPRFLGRPSEPPPIDAPMKPMEGAYNRYLDNPQAGPVPGIKPYAPGTLQKLIGPPPAEVAPVGPPAAPLGMAPPGPPFGGGRGGPPPASGAPAPPAAAPARHPKGAVDKSGNKIGGQFISED